MTFIHHKPSHCLTLMILNLAIGAASAAQDLPPMGLTQLTHVAIVDVERGLIKPDQTVIIRGNRITAVEPGGLSKIISGARTTDCSGKYLIPGLWDMHAHGTYVPWTLSMAAANGVLGLRDMGMGLEQMKMLPRARDGFRHYAFALPIPVRVGAIAGPVLESYSQWPDIGMMVKNPEEGRAAVDTVKAAGADFVKIHTQMSSETWWAIVSRAHELQIPFAGHVPYAISALTASDQGQASIEHLHGLFEACSSDENSLRKESAEHLLTAEGTYPKTWSRLAGRYVQSFDRNKCAEVAARLAKNRTWNVPTLVVLKPETELNVRSDPRFRYIPELLFGLWTQNSRGIAPETQQLFKEAMEIVSMLNKAGVPLMAGTDCPEPGSYPGFALHQELSLLVQAGLTPAEALRAATLNPAAFLHVEDKLGSVTPGKLADLVLLDADPLADIRNTTKIHAVISNGRFFNREFLNQVLQDLVQTDGSSGATRKAQIREIRPRQTQR